MLALLLVGVAIAGVLTVVLVRSHRGPVRPDPDGFQTLSIAAEALVRRSPTLLSGFLPLHPAELAAPDARAIRGNHPFVLLAPTGVILDQPPTFRWEEIPGPTRWADRILRITRTPDMAVVWQGPVGNSPCSPADLPRLEPGVAYLWQVVGDRAAGARVARRFTVATEAQRQRFQDAVRQIRSEAPELSELLIAHLAIRRDLYGEAERAVRSFLRRHPDHGLARATLHYLHARVGAGEAVSRS